MNALQMGIFQARAGLANLNVREFLQHWADARDAEDALEAMSPRGRERVAQWAERAGQAARDAGADQDLIGEFHLLAEAARAAHERAVNG